MPLHPSFLSLHVTAFLAWFCYFGKTDYVPSFVLEEHMWGSTLQQWAFWCNYMSACMFVLRDCWVLREGPWESILITPPDRAPPPQYLCPTCSLNSVDSGPAYRCRVYSSRGQKSTECLKTPGGNSQNKSCPESFPLEQEALLSEADVHNQQQKKKKKENCLILKEQLRALLSFLRFYPNT